jgi:putative ATP-dependent endonuclease of OLD family
LFEEPEAFLHPSQQENMAYHLRRLSTDPSQQVFITTHSSTFAGKAAEDLSQIVRVRRDLGVTRACQPDAAGVKALFVGGGQLLQALQLFVADPNIPDAAKGRARRMIANPPQQQIAEDEERFRFQLWLDGERSSLFFADRVLLVEGASERALFNYLLANDWHDLSHYRICVVDVLGKYNFHRFIMLLATYGIAYGVILDDDNGVDHHGAINDLVDRLATSPAVASPQRIPGCLEAFLGLPVQQERADKKPLEIMKAVTQGQITAPQIEALRAVFKTALSLP